MSCRLVMALLLLASACADLPPTRYCTSSSREVCAEHEAIAATLHTPDMNRRIEEARALR